MRLAIDPGGVPRNGPMCRSGHGELGAALSGYPGAEEGAVDVHGKLDFRVQGRT